MYAVKEIIPISCACDFVCAVYDKCYTCDFGYTWYRSITRAEQISPNNSFMMNDSVVMQRYVLVVNEKAYYPDLMV